MRLGILAGAALAATLPTAAGSTYYPINGPSITISYVALKAGAPSWAPLDPTLTGTTDLALNKPFKWSFFPAASGTLHLRVTTSAQTGRKTWWLGITPDAASKNAPDKVTINGFPELMLDVRRVYAGEAHPLSTHFRSEQNQTTKRYALVFTFDTPLPKGRTTWVVATTQSTGYENGALASFADNWSKDSPWPQYAFKRPLPKPERLPVIVPRPPRGR